MIETAFSYLTSDFFINTGILLCVLLVVWVGFQAAARGAIPAFIFYTLGLFATGLDSSQPIGVITALIINGVMLVAAVRHAVLTYIIVALNLIFYFTAMGIKSLPPMIAEAGAALSFAYLIAHMAAMEGVKRVRERIPREADGPESAPDDLAAFPAHRPRYTFKNVIGMDDTKARLLKAGQDAIQQTPGQPPRNGILLFGEPGNGKTFFAEALAGELDISFIKLTNAEAASRWVGQTTENVSKAFDEARAEAQRNGSCMLFIDEIDSFLENREASMGNGQEASRTANALLTLINDIRGTGVRLVAATNFLDRLDGAGVREGRFDFKVEIPPPDETARRSILGKALEGPRLPAVPPTARTGIIGAVVPGMRRPPSRRCPRSARRRAWNARPSDGRAFPSPACGRSASRPSRWRCARAATGSISMI